MQRSFTMLFAAGTLLATTVLAAAASGETLIGAANASGDLSHLNPPTLLGREINPEDPWKGRMRRSWGGALDIYREWEAAQATNATAIPLPSAALGGLALLGGVGSARVMRRPRSE